jgi:peroxiredoxin
VVAVSPQTPEASLSTVERNALGFALLSDTGNAVARKYGLVWHLEPAVQALYARLGHDLPKVNGSGNWDLPVAAGFVIAPDGTVALAHVEPQVNRRLEPARALEAVQALQQQPVK